MRIENSIKNSIIGILGQIVNVLINFLNRSIFIYVLGIDYLGINGLFSNILSILSLAELGIGSAIVYHIYKPLASKKEEELKSLMSLYSKAYRIIGIFVGIVGIGLIPFLDYIIVDKPNVENLTLIYVLFLFNSVVSYFYIYKSSLIIADQKNYIVIIKQQKYMILQMILQIIILIITKQYLVYLIIQVICTILFNISISQTADKIYPFLKDKNIKIINKEKRKTIFKHVGAMMSHKIGGVVVNCTDNILISSFIGVYWVGIYSNYVMIINMLNKFIEQIFTALTASVGNLNAIEDSNKSYDIFQKIFFVNFWIYGFCSTCLFVLFNSFIELWIGNNYTMTMNSVLIIVVNFYIYGMRKSIMTYNTTLGLFWNDRYKPIVEATINLVVSVILLKTYGINGIFVGTFISTITTSLWVEPYILYKHGFKTDLSKYFIKYIKYLVITIISVFITYLIVDYIKLNTLYYFTIKVIICLFIPNTVFIIFLLRTDEFKYFFKLLKNYIRRK
ncbi:Polysaccharide biosynthesis protein [Clostridium butyricum]|uniref:Polysaccharide biosynthesis protein n=1 Tax=Clostridium butyricum TaxID=1492 RepID=A0A6N3BPQ2_CLOBU